MTITELKEQRGLPRFECETIDLPKDKVSKYLGIKAGKGDENEGNLFLTRAFAKRLSKNPFISIQLKPMLDNKGIWRIAPGYQIIEKRR